MNRCSFLTGKRSRAALLVALASLLGACGYVKSGTWDDDDENWSRAYDSKTPDGVELLHSRYSRYPHFTYEARFYFEIAANAEMERELFEHNEMVPTRFEGSSNDPEWFAPEYSKRPYEVWTYADDPTGNFRLLIDPATRRIYLTDAQL